MTVDFIKIRKGMAVCALALAVVNSAHADGYRNPPPTAEGIGKSGANMVFVDDASAISYNPANLAHTTNASVVISATFANSETTFNNASPTAASGQATTEGGWQALPNVFLSSAIGDGAVVLGLGITTPFGQSIEYNPNDLVDLGNFPIVPIHEAQIALVNFNPTVAFKVTDQIAIGLGADIYYSTVSFKQYYPWDAATGGFFPDDQNAEGDGDGYGLGGNAAVSWDVTEKQRLAFSYRSKVKVEYEGDITASPSTAPPQLVNDSFNLDITYPASVGVGYGIVLTDTIKLEAMLEWMEWSTSENLQLDMEANGSVTVPMNWEDTITVAVGGSWQFDEQWIVRAGYGFIESPVPDETMSPALLPDANRHAISFGLGYSVGGHGLDLSYTVSIYEDRNSTNPLYPGSYDIDSDLVGLTYSYAF